MCYFLANLTNSLKTFKQKRIKLSSNFCTSQAIFCPIICFPLLPPDYTLWKNYDYGIWIQTPADSVEVVNNKLIENGLGVWTATFSPGPLSHNRLQKNVHHIGGEQRFIMSCFFYLTYLLILTCLH